MPNFDTHFSLNRLLGCVNLGGTLAIKQSLGQSFPLLNTTCYHGSFDSIQVENDTRRYCLGKEESVGYTRLFVGVCEEEDGDKGVPSYVIAIVMALLVYFLLSLASFPSSHFQYFPSQILA